MSPVGSSEETFKKRTGTLAITGFLYEIRICMLLILRCVARGLGFQLKCNVEDQEKLFDDVVCKITRDPAGQVKHLFLQAKHLTGKKASLLKKSTPTNLFPFSVFQDWYDSFKVISSNVRGEYFEMVIYTTVDIEESFLHFFTPSQSEFSDLLLADASSVGNVYCISHTKLQEYIVNNGGKVESDVEQFCRALKIFITQPHEEELGRKTTSEIQKPEPESRIIYNEAYAHMEAWYKQQGAVAVIDHDIFATAAQKTDSRIIKHLLTLEKSENEFSFCEETIAKLRQVLVNGKKVTTFCVESFEIYTDLMKQFFRSHREPLNCFLFTLAKFQRVFAKSFKSFKEYKNLTYVLITIEDLDITVENNEFDEIFEDFLVEVDQIPNLRIIFLAKLDPATRDNLPEKFNICTDLALGSLQSLDSGTRQEILEYDIQFMGEASTLEELRINPEIFIDESVLSDIRMGKSIEIGKALPRASFQSEVYVSRELQVFNQVNEDEIFHSPDRFVIIDETATNQSPEEKIEYESLPPFNSTKCTRSNLEQVLQETSEKHKNQAIHLLERKEGRYLWLNSGSCDKSFFNTIIEETPSTSISEEQFIDDHICDPLSSRVILVSSNPGMGKSQLVHSLALTLVRKTILPVLVNLNRCTELLESLGKEHDKGNRVTTSVIDKFVPKKQLRYFKRFLKDPQKVVFMFDSFDEVCPMYGDIVLRIVEQICQTHVKNVVILTRTHLASLVQYKTGALLVHLNTLARSDVETYLYRFYNFNLVIEEEEEIDRVRIFISALMRFIYNETRAYWVDVTGVPLQTCMVAAVFRDRCEQYVKNTQPEEDPDILPSENDANIDLYERIIDLKIRIALIEKSGGPSTVTLSEQLRYLREPICAQHVQCAIVLLIDTRYARKFFNIDLTQILRSPHEICRYGIIVSLRDEYIEFIHRSFAEYFCATMITEQLINPGGSILLLEYLFNRVLGSYVFESVRKFIDTRLSNLGDNVGFNCLDSRSLPVVFKCEEGYRYSSCSDNEMDVAHGMENARFFIHDTEWVPMSECRKIVFLAVEEGNLHIARRLLNLRHQEGGEEVVHRLLTYQDEGLVQYPLDLAVEKGHTEMVRELLDAGADTNLQGLLPPLCVAVRDGREDIARLLLAAEANPDITLRKEGSPLEVAARNGDIELVRTLLEHGATPNPTQRFIHYPLPPLPVNKYTSGSLFGLLRRKSLDLEAVAASVVGWRQTALHAAAREGHHAVVELLLEHGADPSYPDSDQKTALQVAADPAVVQQLIQRFKQ